MNISPIARTPNIKEALTTLKRLNNDRKALQECAEGLSERMHLPKFSYKSTEGDSLYIQQQILNVNKQIAKTSEEYNNALTNQITAQRMFETQNPNLMFSLN